MIKLTIKEKINDAIEELENLVDFIDGQDHEIEEAHDIDVSEIIEWFKSPFVSDFDKQTAIKSYKREA
jgi:hypothetical protein